VLSTWRAPARRAGYLQRWASGRATVTTVSSFSRQWHASTNSLPVTVRRCRTCLTVTATCHSTVTRNIQPAVAGAVTTPRRASRWLRFSTRISRFALADLRRLRGPSVQRARFSLRSSGPARQVMRGGLTLRSTGPAGTCLDLRSASARRAGYLYR
jgi:hypothetical protein